MSRLATRLLFRITQHYRAPAPFVAAWLQARDAASAAPLAWTVRRGSIEATHRVEPDGADASTLHIDARTTNGALSTIGPLVKLVVWTRAPRLARQCERAWQAQQASAREHVHRA